MGAMQVIERLRQATRKAAIIVCEHKGGDKREVAQPLSEFFGERVSTAVVADRTGYAVATIRNWCKSGKLTYTMENGRYYVCADEKYAALQPNEKGELRARVRALEDENAKLRQQTFEFERAEMQAKIDALEAENKRLREQNAPVNEQVSKAPNNDSAGTKKEPQVETDKYKQESMDKYKQTWTKDKQIWKDMPEFQHPQDQQIWMHRQSLKEVAEQAAAQSGGV